MQGWQIEQSVVARQAALPVVELRSELRAAVAVVGKARALPCGVVRVLDRRRRQRRHVAEPRRAIASREIAQQHIDRPAIAHDVMHNDMQHIMIRVTNKQRRAKERAERQVEGLASASAQLRVEVVGAEFQRVDAFPAPGIGGVSGGRDQLTRHAVDIGKARAQHLVAAYQRVERGSGCMRIERTRQRKCGRNVVGGAVRIELPQHPQPLLRQR